MIRCKLEENTRTALSGAGIKYIEDGTKGLHGATKHLDFYLPDFDVYVEVTRSYTPRKVEQASRVENIILLQGSESVALFCKLLTPYTKPTAR